MKYNKVLFGVKTDTYQIYKKIADDVDLVVTLNDDEKQNYHISGGEKINRLVNSECFESDSYKLDSKYCNDFFENNSFDIGIVCGWQRLIPQSVLDKFKYGVFGFHASPLGLPFGKGRSPMNWSIISGYPQVYNHCFQYNSEADGGLLYSTTELEIFECDDILSLKKKVLIDMENSIHHLIQDYKNDDIQLVEQDNTIEESFFPKRKPKDGEIDFSKKTEDIYNLIRGVSKPFPGAFITRKNGTKLVIWKCKIFSYNLFKDEKVGKIVKMFDDKSFVLKTIDGSILIEDYEIL